MNRPYEHQNSDNFNFASESNSSEYYGQNVDIESLQSKGTTFDKKVWNTVKSLSHKNKQTPLRCIVFDNQKVTSIKNIANISKQFFIDKIIKLRGQFIPPNISAIDILSKIFPRNQSPWKLELITIDQTLEIIRKAKGTNSLGPDNISMKIIKKN